MATITSTASGNFSAGATWVGGVAPGANDDAVAATGHTIVIDTDVTVLSFQQAGTGKFTLGNGRTVTGNVIANAGTFTSGGTVDVICGAGESATITGNVTGASTTANNTAGIVVSGVGTLTLNGTVTGSPGSGSSEANGSAGVYTNVTCTITINGAVTGGTGSHKRGVQAGSSSNAIITIVGNVSSGNGGQSYAAFLQGATPNVTITGNVLTGTGSSSWGMYITGSSPTITITGNVTASSTGASDGQGIYGTSATPVITVTGNVTGATSGGGVGIWVTGSPVITVNGNVIGGSVAAGRGIQTDGASSSILVTGNVTGGSGSTADGIRSNGTSSSVTVVGTVIANGTVSHGILSAATSSANGVFLTGSMTDSTSGLLAIRTTYLRVASGTGTTTHATPGSPTGSANPRFSADQILGVPAASNVRSGTTYGNPATLTGTLAVPAANQVAVGVAVDNTIGTAVLTESTLRAAVGLASANLDAQFAAINVDFTPILNRLPTALVGGRMDSSVGAMAANTLTASALATDAVTEIQAGLALEATSQSIKAKTDLITAGQVQIVSPVGAGGNITTPIFAGDDYKASNGRAFEWTIDARTGFSASTATCRFGGSSEETGDSWNVAGTVTDIGGGEWELSFDLTKTVTATLSPGFYRWSVELKNPSDDEVTEVYNSNANRQAEVRAKQT